MIPKLTVDKIIETALIEDVIGDFLILKKKGVNLLGLCPFHGEKSPSFTVSPAKGIYKCFGCGKAGTAVNFIMDHEALSFPDALKYLAKKYNIEVEETQQSDEEKLKQSEKESLLIILQYANTYFQNLLHNNDFGRSIGLEYFTNRGFTLPIIQKFQLGYSLEAKRSFADEAIKQQYNPKLLVKSGMCVSSKQIEDDTLLQPQDVFDRFAGRVMFPILNITGKVIGFGGRTLTADKKIAKYLNSPQTEVYDKSKVLYGLFQAKQVIMQQDKCYLVEGYTDVISMHQVGIENVVASSGTSLTIDQIKLIHRFTKNITILYDSDFAGIKASFRGIDMILEEGLNVRVVLFPDGDDPDSFSKKVSLDEYKSYINNNEKDFITFKIDIHLKESQHDPIKKAELITNIVQSIAVIPDSIKRSVYIKACAKQMDIEEQVLIIETNKFYKTKLNKLANQQNIEPELIENAPQVFEPLLNKPIADNKIDNEEQQLLRLMMLYGNVIIDVNIEVDNNQEEIKQLTICEYIMLELLIDNINFENPIYKEVLRFIQNEMDAKNIPSLQDYINNPNQLISQLSITLTTFNHTLSPHWQRKSGAETIEEVKQIKVITEHWLLSLKDKRLGQMILEAKNMLQDADPFENPKHYQFVIKLEEQKKRVNKLLGRTIIK